MGTPVSDKDAARVSEIVRRAEEALEELTALGLSVDVVLGNRIVSKPRHSPIEQNDTLLKGKDALAYFNNPEVADCVLVLGSQHIKASSAYLSRWSSFFEACFEHDMAEKASRIVTVEPPSSQYFVSTIEYLYTGIFPTSACESSDVLFGLLTNAQYLSCDRLIKKCLTQLDTVLKGDGYKAFTSHACFQSTCVPAELVQRLAPSEPALNAWAVHQAVTGQQKKFKYVDIVLDWLHKETTVTEEGDAMAKACEQILGGVDFSREDYNRLFDNFRASVAYPCVLKKGLQRIFYSRKCKGDRCQVYGIDK